MSPRKTKPDPVFDLIAQHRQAAKARAKAAHKLDQVEKRIEKKEGPRAHTLHSLTSAFPPMPVGVDYMVKFAGNIPRHVEDGLHDATRRFGPKTGRKIRALRTFAEDELQAAYRRHLRAHIRAQRASGYEAASGAASKASEREQTILRRLSVAKPSTTEGIAALLDYYGSIVESAGTLDGAYTWAGKPMRALAEALSTSQR